MGKQLTRHWMLISLVLVKKDCNPDAPSGDGIEGATFESWFFLGQKGSGNEQITFSIFSIHIN